MNEVYKSSGDGSGKAIVKIGSSKNFNLTLSSLYHVKIKEKIIMN